MHEHMRGGCYLPNWESPEVRSTMTCGYDIPDIAAVCTVLWNRFIPNSNPIIARNWWRTSFGFSGSSVRNVYALPKIRLQMDRFIVHSHINTPNPFHSNPIDPCKTKFFRPACSNQGLFKGCECQSLMENRILMNICAPQTLICDDLPRIL